MQFVSHMLVDNMTETYILSPIQFRQFQIEFCPDHEVIVPISLSHDIRPHVIKHELENGLLLAASFEENDAIFRVTIPSGNRSSMRFYKTVLDLMILGYKAHAISTAIKLKSLGML